MTRSSVDFLELDGPSTVRSSPSPDDQVDPVQRDGVAVVLDDAVEL